MKQPVVYVHGQGGSANEAEHYRPLFEGREVVGFDYRARTPREAREEFPRFFDRLRAEHPEEVAVLAVHTPPVTTDVGEYLSGFSYTVPFAVDEDGSLGAALNASDVLPQTVILSPEGVVAYNQSGSLSYERLLELFEAAKG